MSCAVLRMGRAKMRLGGFVFGFLGCWFSLSAYAADGLSLSQRWEIEKRAPFQGMSESTLSVLREKYMLLVPGLMNGLAHFPGIAKYYQAVVEAAQNELGMGVSYFGLKSAIPIPVNAEMALYPEIVRMYSRVRKPLILVGHSKGGAEVLYTLLKHPELMLRLEGEGPVVDRVVLLQAAIGGAHFLSGNYRGITLWILSWFLRGGLESLSPVEAAQNFTEAFSSFRQTLEVNYGQGGDAYGLRREISSRVFFVRGATRRLGLGLKAAKWMLGIGHEVFETDGLIDIQSQMLPQLDEETFGTDLGVIELDHMESCVSGWLSRSTDADRRALVRAVLEQIH